MPSKQTQRRKGAKQRDALCFRALAVRTESLDDESRSVETVITTETPVPMMDWDRWEMVPEVLRAGGAALPDQVPLLDSHNRASMDNQFGSVREMVVEKDKITGRLFFASDDASQRAFLKVKEGHARDVSAGYQVMEKTFVPKGQKAIVAGREYTGPLNVVTKWKLREVSLTPIGADEQAKLRGLESVDFPETKGFTMNEQLRKLLESRGMPTGLDDDKAQEWAIANLDAKRSEGDPSKSDVKDESFRKAIEEAAAQAARKAIEEQDRKRSELRAIAETCCKIGGLEFEARAFEQCGTREQIEAKVIELRQAKQSNLPLTPSIAGGVAEFDKFRSGMATALNMRCLDTVAPDADDKTGEKRAAAKNRVFPVESRSKEATQFTHASLYDMARSWVERVNRIDTLGMSRESVATIALFGPQRANSILGLGLRDAGAYHTTGSFAELTRDAMNKSMMLGYTEAPSTWERVMRRGASVSDFKQINRLRLGAIPNLPIWPDNKDPERASVQDAREVYSVQSYSLAIDFSYQLLINDDMDALSRLPGQMGNAARRTINAVAWSVITANPTMSDGVALFAAATGNRKRTNLTTGAGAPSTTTLQTLTNLMMQMRGENTPEGEEGSDILNLMPRYLVGPSALRTSIMQLVMSVYDPANANQAYNMASELVPVIEPLLDARSATAWYLFADPSQIDTVEVSFLQGQESPQVRQVLDEQKLSQTWTILQTFGAKAMNHRGIQQHAGA